MAPKKEKIYVCWLIEDHIPSIKEMLEAHLIGEKVSSKKYATPFIVKANNSEVAKDKLWAALKPRGVKRKDIHVRLLDNLFKETDGIIMLRQTETKAKILDFKVND